MCHNKTTLVKLANNAYSYHVYGLIQLAVNKREAVGLFESLTGKAALPILWEFLKLYPSPEAVRDAEWQPIAKMITPLGLHEKRAQIMIRFSSKQAAFHCGYCFLVQCTELPVLSSSRGIPQ